jgi:hypothetical protein
MNDDYVVNLVNQQTLLTPDNKTSVTETTQTEANKIN